MKASLILLAVLASSPVFAAPAPTLNSNVDKAAISYDGEGEISYEFTTGLRGVTAPGKVTISCDTDSLEVILRIEGWDDLAPKEFDASYQKVDDDSPSLNKFVEPVARSGSTAINFKGGDYTASSYFYKDDIKNLKAIFSGNGIDIDVDYYGMETPLLMFGIKITNIVDRYDLEKFNSLCIKALTP
jgi:hypothetical protein